jgi:hypothetical protein
LPLRLFGSQFQSIMPDETQVSKIKKAYSIRLTSRRGSLAAAGPCARSSRQGGCVEEALVLLNVFILAGPANPANCISMFGFR